MPKRPTNVLSIPSVFGSGVAAPQSVATRRQVMNRGGQNTLEVPSQGTFSQAIQQQGCCPCPPQSQGPGPGPQGQSPFGPPQGQGPGNVPGLGQPSRPQKPFQVPPQTPCEFVEEELGRMGLTPQMLADCIKPQRRSPPRRRAAATPSRQPAARKKPKKKGKKKPAQRAVNRTSRGTIKGGPRFKLFKGTGGRMVCRDQATNKFVKRSRCN